MMSDTFLKIIIMHPSEMAWCYWFLLYDRETLIFCLLWRWEKLGRLKFQSANRCSMVNMEESSHDEVDKSANV